LALHLGIGNCIDEILRTNQEAQLPHVQFRNKNFFEPGKDITQIIGKGIQIAEM
jgi:hypothetical protein